MTQSDCVLLDEGSFFQNTSVPVAPASPLLARTGLLIAASHLMVLVCTAAFLLFVVLLRMDM